MLNNFSVQFERNPIFKKCSLFVMQSEYQEDKINHFLKIFCWFKWIPVIAFDSEFDIFPYRLLVVIFINTIIRRFEAWHTAIDIVRAISLYLMTLEVMTDDDDDNENGWNNPIKILLLPAFAISLALLKPHK